MFVIRVEGPSRTAAPSAVRLTRNVSLLQTQPGLTVPPVFEQPTATVPIQKLASSTNRVPGPISATKLRDTGPDNNRLVYVVLGDGYTAANLAAGQFTTAANNFVNAFGSKSPWDVLFLGTNVYRIDVESNEQGADNDPSQGILKDTYFNSDLLGKRDRASSGSRWYRLLSCGDCGEQPGRIRAVGLPVHSGQFDQVRRLRRQYRSLLGALLRFGDPPA